MTDRAKWKCEIMRWNQNESTVTVTGLHQVSLHSSVSLLCNVIALSHRAMLLSYFNLKFSEFELNVTCDLEKWVKITHIGSKCLCHPKVQSDQV